MESLLDFFHETYRPLRLTGRSESNAEQHRIQIRHFARFLGRMPRLDDLSDENVTRFLGWLLDKGRAPATVNKARSHLVALWRLAAEKRVVAQFPAVRVIDEPERIPEAWTIAQLKRLFRACLATPGEIRGVPASLWWEAFHRVIFDSGERTGATLSIEWAWIDLETRWLVIPASARKGRKKPMAYSLRPQTIASLQDIVRPQRQFVFEWPWTLCTFYNHYNRLLERAGLPNRRIDKPQKVRRSHASHLEARGGNATESLGHTSRRITVKNYIDPRIAKRDSHADRLPDV